MANNTSQHILSTAANLLGFCLFVITAIHFTDKSEISLIDEFTSFVALLLTCSCILSFISLRTSNLKREFLYEKIAEYLFISSLIGILIIITLIYIHFIK